MLLDQANGVLFSAIAAPFNPPHKRGEEISPSPALVGGLGRSFARDHQ